MDQPDAIIRNWFAKGELTVRQVTVGRGFSGAQLRQVEHERRLFVLRRWPMGSVDARRLESIHAFQQKLAAHGLPVPSPVRTRDSGTFVKAERHFWELAPWMPGAADYWPHPRPEKLSQALQTLAHIHCVSGLKTQVPSFVHSRHIPGLPSRIARLKDLVQQGHRLIPKEVAQLAGAERAQAEQAYSLVQRLAPVQLAASGRWNNVRLPLATCLRDIWHDHVLFTGDRVTGVIDFGAATTGAPAADIARLLGSMVGDDWDRWADGLAAYDAVRPLTDDEREAVRFFDSTGVVLSAANWLQWLYGAPAARLAGTFDREAALGRFNILVGRLRNLADARG